MRESLPDEDTLWKGKGRASEPDEQERTSGRDHVVAVDVGGAAERPSSRNRTSTRVQQPSHARPPHDLPDGPGSHLPTLAQSSSPLLRLLDQLPEHPSRRDFLDLRTVAKSSGALADVAFVRDFVLRANRHGFEDVGVRLFRQSLPLLLHPHSTPVAAVARMAESVLEDLVARKRWVAALDVSNALNVHDLTIPTLLVLRMRVLSGRGRFAEVVQTFRQNLERADPPPAAFDVAINAQLCQANLDGAQTLLAEKARRGLPTTAETYLLLLDGMDVFGGNSIMEDKMLGEGTEEDVRRGIVPRQDVRILNRLMSVRAARGALRDAIDVLHFYDFSPYPTDVVDALRALSSPAPVLSEVSGRRPRPDAATAVILVGIALRQQRPDLAERILVAAARSGITLNDHVAAAALRILLARHDIVAAEAFVQALEMGSASLGPVRFPAIPTSSKVCELLLAGMLRYKGVAGANASFRRLLEVEGIAAPVSEGMTLALVDYLAAAGPLSNLGLSSTVLLQVQQLTQGTTRPDSRHLDVLLKAAWQRDRLLHGGHARDQARSVMSEELSQGAPEAPRAASPPDEAELLVRPASARKQATPTSRLRDSLADRDVRHSRDTSRHVIRNDHILRFIDAKWDYLQTQVVDLGIRPTYHHVTVLMRAYLRMGDSRGANSVLRYATQDLGLEPHVAFYSTLIAGLARLGKFGAAARAYQDFQASGLEPDRNLYAAVAMSCARRRDVVAVERVFDEMRAFLRSRAPHPQLQAQALKTAASASASNGFPAVISAPYDPLLDALFVTILYRAQTGAGQYAKAQNTVSQSLDRGMVPDTVLLKALQRTRKWIRHKESQLGGSGRSTVRAGGVDNTELSRAELEQIKGRNAYNVSRVRKTVRRMTPSVDRGEIRDLERYWREVESGPDEAVSSELDHVEAY